MLSKWIFVFPIIIFIVVSFLHFLSLEHFKKHFVLLATNCSLPTWHAYYVWTYCWSGADLHILHSSATLHTNYTECAVHLFLYTIFALRKQEANIFNWLKTAIRFSKNLNILHCCRLAYTNIWQLTTGTQAFFGPFTPIKVNLNAAAYCDTVCLKLYGNNSGKTVYRPYGFPVFVWRNFTGLHRTLTSTPSNTFGITGPPTVSQAFSPTISAGLLARFHPMESLRAEKWWVQQVVLE